MVLINDLWLDLLNVLLVLVIKSTIRGPINKHKLERSKYYHLHFGQSWAHFIYHFFHLHFQQCNSVLKARKRALSHLEHLLLHFL